MKIEKMLLILDHIKGELSLLLLHPEQRDPCYELHVMGELTDLADEINSPPSEATHEATDKMLLRVIEKCEKELKKRHPKDYR